MIVTSLEKEGVSLARAGAGSPAGLAAGHAAFAARLRAEVARAPEEVLAPMQVGWLDPKEAAAAGSAAIKSEETCVGAEGVLV